MSVHGLAGWPQGTKTVTARADLNCTLWTPMLLVLKVKVNGQKIAVSC